MPSISLTELPELLGKEVYPVLFEAYRSITPVYLAVCNVRSIDMSFKGTKEHVVTGLGRPEEVKSGQEIPLDQMGSKHTWRVAGKTLARAIEISLDDLEANDATSTVVAKLRKAGEQWGKGFQQEKDIRVANIFQKGTLSAGNTDAFDNSYEGEEDPNPGFIYDGKPFFAASGNGHILKGNSDLPYNHIASNALTTANLQTVLTRFRTENAVDERGNRIFLNPNTLMVPPALEWTARTILGSGQLPGTANNDMNPVAGTLNLVINPYLSDSSSQWYVGEVGGGDGSGVEVWDSGAPMLVTEVDQTRRRMVRIAAVGKFGAAVTNWRQWFGNNKATS